jgi:hypothetical protein
VSVPYIETFQIAGVTYGVEDFQDGRPAEEHFMSKNQRPSHRYKPWANGCGIAQGFATLDEARMSIYAHAKKRVGDRYLRLTKELEDLSLTRSKLAPESPFSILDFRT